MIRRFAPTAACNPSLDMFSLDGMGGRPLHVTHDAHFGPWFAEIANLLLNHVDFLISGEAYRFAELEAYYHGEGHLDPFTHRDSAQFQNRQWYFHRTGGQYRGGSFKGIDLTFGNDVATFGMLIRAIVAPNGDIIDGPSLTVDHLLARTGSPHVRDLDALIARRSIWDLSSPIAIRPSETPRTAAVLSTGRVGLTLKRSLAKPEGARYIMRPYRYLTEPRRIAKGKLLMVLALHQSRKDPYQIRRLTGATRKAIERYIDAFTAGKQLPGLEEYVSKDLTPRDLSKLIGSWSAQYLSNS